MNFGKKIILLFFLVSALCVPVLAFPQISLAEVIFTPQVPLEGTKFEESYTYEENSGTKAIGIYIREIYRYALGIVGILAAVVLMAGGFLYAMAAGSQDKITQARSYIVGALSGLILAFSSYLILSFISQDLVNLKITPVQQVTPDKEIKEDSNLDCGVYDEVSFLCGSKCPSPLEACVKVGSETANAKECPVTLDGKGQKWSCQRLGGCCENNNDVDCMSNAVCNMALSTCGRPKGTCSAKLGQNQPCEQKEDCLDGCQCASGRCSCASANEGQPCGDGGACASGLYCFGRAMPINSGFCYNGSSGDPCASDSQCGANSDKCVNNSCYNDCINSGKNNLSCIDDCKQSNWLTVCLNDIPNKCSCRE